ncbi:hypothetical protein P5673_003727, partial [Acropora cervicornis]
HDNEDPPKDPSRPGNRTSGSSFLAHPSLVASPHEDVDKGTSSNTQQKEHTDTSSGPQSCPPPIQTDVVAPLPFIRELLQSQGISSSAAHIIMQSWRTSKRVQYRSYIKKWTAYCCKWKIDPVSPPIASGVNFLAELYNQGLSYSALNTARSALSSIISLQGNFSFGNHPLVSLFLKGTFTIRPAMPKYNEVWDVNEVLKHLQTLQPLNELSLKLLSFKVVMLLALLSGQRCQTLHSLTTRDMKVYHNKVVFIVSELTKTSKPGKQCTTLEFLSYDKDPRLCLVRCLKEYLDRTANMRQDHHKLLVSYQKPHKSISKDTVARWLKQELKLAGIDTSTFGAHSTRAASTSAAKAHNVSITTIMKSAGWSSESTFSKFYNKAIAGAKENFGQKQPL